MARERKRKEREVAERIKRVKKAQKAQEKARREQEKRDKVIFYNYVFFRIFVNWWYCLQEFEEQMKKEMPNFNFQGMPGMSGFNFGGAGAPPPKEKAENSSDNMDAEPEETPKENGEPKIFEVPTDIDLD